MYTNSRQNYSSTVTSKEMYLIMMRILSITVILSNITICLSMVSLLQVLQQYQVVQLIRFILLHNGSKYNEAPTVTISGDGTGATATAYLANITLSGGSPTSSAVIRATVKEGEIRSVQDSKWWCKL